MLLQACDVPHQWQTEAHLRQGPAEGGTLQLLLCSSLQEQNSVLS
jgi:hypothetical protein